MGMKQKVSPRIRTFIRDAAKFLAYIRKDAIDLARHLQSNGNDYVKLNWFFNNPLENCVKVLVALFL